MPRSGPSRTSAGDRPATSARRGRAPGLADAIRRALPERPRQRHQGCVGQDGLPAYDAGLLTQSRALAEYFEATVRAGANAKAASNWMMSELLRVIPGDDER